MKYLMSKKNIKVKRDVNGYACTDCIGCCIDGCANLCSSCSNFCSWLVITSI
ncbi:MAG: Cys-rich RiPP precursor [Clostridium sp.]|nr:Cys-rich RiPP precursor [Clostridium sp.]